MGGKLGHDPQDTEIRRLAEAHYGVVSRAQLLVLGVGSDAIDHRLKVGRLCRVHRGVYAVVGPRLLTQRGRWLAAVLASGPGAVSSYFAAAGLWGIRRSSRLEVTVPRGGRTARQGIRLHYANLPADEITTHDGIPTTTVPRTLLDLGAVLQRDELRSAMRQAEQLRLTDRLWLGDLLERYPRKPGTPTLRAVVEEAQRGMNVVRSDLEELFQAFLIRAGIPLPSTNVLVEGYEVDCTWADAGLVVELDSRTHHAITEAFEADRVRDRRLEAEGWRVVRITWRALHDTPGAVEADLRKLLTPRRQRGVPTRSRRP